MYVIEKRKGKQTITGEQVDTNDGPLYRLLSIDGRPLDASQRQQETIRLDRLLQDPSRQLKAKQAHDEDEQKLETVMRMMPAAFLYECRGNPVSRESGVRESGVRALPSILPGRQQTPPFFLGTFIQISFCNSIWFFPV